MLRLCQPFERAPYALGLDELILGRLHRSVRAALFNGDLARLEDLLNREWTRLRQAYDAASYEWTRKFHHRELSAGNAGIAVNAVNLVAGADGVHGDPGV